MKTLRAIPLMAASLLVLGGCANWALQEKCENTNWFEYSQNVAFQGKYLEEDGFIKACKGIDTTSAVQLDLGFKQGREKMCQYDEIYLRAREGVPVFFQFCDGLDKNQMKHQYTQGLLAFCTKEKGYTFGKSGKLYQNLCNPQQEKAFLPAYFQGRREYLTDTLKDLRERLESLKTLETSYARTEQNVELEYRRLPTNMAFCKTISVYNSNTQKNEFRTVCEEAFYIKNRREELWVETNQIRKQLAGVREEWKKIDQSIAQAQADLNALPAK